MSTRPLGRQWHMWLIHAGALPTESEPSGSSSAQYSCSHSQSVGGPGRSAQKRESGSGRDLLPVSAPAWQGDPLLRLNLVSVLMVLTHCFY